MAKNNDVELERYTRDLWNTIMRIIHSFRSGSVLKEDVELSLPQSLMLLELNQAGTISMKELSQRLQMNQGVATRMVDRLLEKDMVERKRDKVDRRVVLVWTSVKGKRIAEEMERVNKTKIMELFQAVPIKEREDFLKFLQGMERQFEGE
jgi:DNA-binding MarR family transcriptional regulator